jgi:NAD(P)-dependent dehydrogenase (short-subunit alcohol dehydrogenase family)
MILNLCIPGHLDPCDSYGLIACQLTRHLSALGVRVNALSPGGVRAQQDEQFQAKYSARVALGRMAEPADLVTAIVTESRVFP